MMKLCHSIVFFGCALLLVACNEGHHLMSDMLGGGGGAALGYGLSGGKSLGAIGGAAVGIGASKLLRNEMEKTSELRYKEGYESGISQSAREQYHIIQNFQKRVGSQDEAKWVAVKIREQEIEGELQKERIEYVKVRS